MTRRSGPALVIALLAAACGDATPTGPRARAAVARVVAFTPGDGAGFGADSLPEVIQGPPRGFGDRMGSTDVLSLGRGGEITIELEAPAIDGVGADLVIFENTFYASGDPGAPFAEPGFVSLSADGLHFVEHPCLPEARPGYAGCAGVRPVFAHAEWNGLDPADPSVAGGDPFDLAEVGLREARFVRIRDSGVGPVGGGGTDGFDLDAIVVVPR